MFLGEIAVIGKSQVPGDYAVLHFLYMVSMPEGSKNLVAFMKCIIIMF